LGRETRIVFFATSQKQRGAAKNRDWENEANVSWHKGAEIFDEPFTVPAGKVKESRDCSCKMARRKARQIGLLVLRAWLDGQPA
jgi:hypothetical protein